MCGIVISLYWADHPPPHFHARYGEHRAALDIATLEVVAGGLSSRAMRLVREWERCTGPSCSNVGAGARPPAVGYDRTVAMPDPIPIVTAVEVLHDFVLGVTFDDGTAGEVDLLPHLWGPVFDPLRDDPALFAQARVDDEEATIV